MAASLSVRWARKADLTRRLSGLPLKRAREKRDEARQLIADDIDPSAERKAKRAALLETFEGSGQGMVRAAEQLARARDRLDWILLGLPRWRWARSPPEPLLIVIRERARP